MHLENKIQHEQYEELVSSFIQLHKTQFQALGLPEIYWRDLCMKLKDEVLTFLAFKNSPINLINLFIYLRYSMLETFSNFVNVLMRITLSLATKQFV